MSTVFIQKEAHRARNGDCRRLPQGAQRSIGHDLGSKGKQVDCLFAAVAVSDLIDDPAELTRTFAARRARPAPTRARKNAETI